jgi:hypothetical protein
MLYRIIGSVLVVVVCVGGYLAFGRDSASAQTGSDAVQTQSAAPAAAPSDDLPQININNK